MKNTLLRRIKTTDGPWQTLLWSFAHLLVDQKDIVEQNMKWFDMMKQAGIWWWMGGLLLYGGGWVGYADSGLNLSLTGCAA